MQYAQEIWAKTLEILERELGMSKTSIDTWFVDIKAVSFENNCLTVLIKNDFVRGYVESQYASRITEALKILFSVDIKLRVTDSEEEAEAPVQRRFTEEYSFERFVVGSSNTFAHAAAKAVAQAPATSYNPLLIYGGSGLGKTHLLFAIANTVEKNNPSANIVYVKGADFINEFIESIQARTADEFRNKYREADLLLVDDIQFIAGHPRTEEEFFHTFNTLHEAHKQIVLISDRLPSEMVNLEERLRTRFESGLIVDIQPPDYETRLAIINLKCRRLGLDLAAKQKETIANNVTSNVRQIEGVIKKIHAYSSLLQTEITDEIVQRAISDMIIENPGLNPTPEIIIKEVSKYYQIEETVLLGKNQSKGTVLPRQIAMYLIREIIHSSFPDIGKMFSGRDHTTVLHAYNKIKDMIRTNQEFKIEIKDIRNNILES